MTAEDPVEYNLFGINQVLVRTEIGMTFAAALKAFLRQDPNIIMVGEIRDLETGGIAIKAALTGHLVLSTLHTNSAPETVTRLLDMGLEPFNVASALNLVLAQRLVRRSARSCKAKYVPDDEELAAREGRRRHDAARAKFTEEALDNAKRASATPEALPLPREADARHDDRRAAVLQGHGLRRVRRHGAQGPSGPVRSHDHDAEAAQADHAERRRGGDRDAAIEEGMLTLRMDGWLKVMKGITTLEQVIRETSA